MKSMKNRFWIFEESDGNGNVTVLDWIQAASYEEAVEKFRLERREEFSAPYQAGGYEDCPVWRSNQGVIVEFIPGDEIFCGFEHPQDYIEWSRD